MIDLDAENDKHIRNILMDMYSRGVTMMDEILKDPEIQSNPKFKKAFAEGKKRQESKLAPYSDPDFII